MSTKAKLRYLRFVLPSLVSMLLVTCDARSIAYQGTCAEQTQQFLDYIHSLVTDELIPVIDDGFIAGPTADVMKRIEELNTRISKVNTPECNTRTQAVKEALLLYMLETRNYFSVVAGRAVYGEGPVQGQRSKMYEAGWAFERAFEDVRKQPIDSKIPEARLILTLSFRRLLRLVQASPPCGGGLPSGATDTHRRLKRAAGTLGDLPLVVLTQRSGWLLSPSLSSDTRAKMEQVWQDLQVNLASLSSNSTHVIAVPVGQTTPADEDQQIIDALLKVVSAANR